MKSWDAAEAIIEAHERQAASERQKAVAAEQQRQQQKQHAERLRNKLLDIMWAEVGATPAEITRVTRLIRENSPEQIDNVVSYRMKLLTIRSLSEVSQKLGK